MLYIFCCALAWLVEDIINSNLAGIRWYPDYLQLFTNNNKKIYKLKKINKNKNKKNREKKEEETFPVGLLFEPYLSNST